MTAPYRVLCEGIAVGEFDTHEDAMDMANVWNIGYPAPEYPEFVVEQPCADTPCSYCSAAS